MHSDAIKRRRKQESGLCMAKYLLDSNVIIDYLRKEKNVSCRLGESRRSDDVLAICSHVYYEVVRGFKGDEDSRRYRAFLTLYKSWKIFPFDMRAAKKAVEIYL